MSSPIACGGAPRRVARLVWLQALCVSAGVAAAMGAHADALAGESHVAIWIAPEARIGDRFGWSDFQPVPHGQPGVRLGLGYPVGGAVAATASGYIGGSSYRFTGFSAVGKLKDLRWDVRTGLERRWRLESRSTLRAGIAFEYGEARSWFKSAQQNQIGQRSEEGPRNYLVGVSICAGQEVRLSQRVALRYDLGLSVLWGRAAGVVTSNDYRWLGDDLGFSLGLAYVLR